MKKTIVFLSLFLPLLWSCGQEQGGQGKEETPAANTTNANAANPNAEGPLPQDGKPVKLSGKLQNVPSTMVVFIDRWNFESMTTLGSFRLKEDGSFETGFGVKEPGLYRLRVGMAAIWLLLEGGETMSLTASIDNNNIPTYEVKGSDLTQEASTWVNNLSTDAIAKYVREQPNSKALLKLFLLGRLPIAQYMDEIKKIKTDVQARYPETELSKGLATRVDQAEAQINQATIMVGKPVPDIRLADPNGKNMALSELKGKVVLIDFWASWCGPCRRENPNVVRIYNKFKDKGFTVYSVSLDGLDDRQQLSMQSNPEALKRQIETKRQAWIQAIKDDGLIWPYHVSELRSWSSSVAQLYGIDAIPRTFLLDRNGVLRYVNLRGGELEAKIQELLG